MTRSRFPLPTVALVATVALFATPSAVAQGSFTTYGQGCMGTGAATCPSGNANATTQRYLSYNGISFALPVPAQSRASMVDGFEFYTNAISSPATITTRLYTDASGWPGSLVATGTMTIGTTLGWYRTTFSSPVLVQANTQYFIGFVGTMNQFYFPMVPNNAGTLNTHFWYSASGWSGPWTVAAWAWKVNCRQAPEIGCTGVPTIGQTHTITLVGARPNATAYLAFGSQRIQFPFPGAPGCVLLTDPLLLLGRKTDGTGALKVSEPVPNDPALKGREFLHQFGVLDLVNPAGIVFSAGGAVKL